MNREEKGRARVETGQADTQRDRPRAARLCPPWCTEEHPDATALARVHRAAAGAFQQPALHSRRGRLLRPARGLLHVEIHVNEDATGRRDEERVTVHSARDVLLELVNGEARRLAALLTAAADRLDGIA